MGFVLVLGGVRSGKSARAEELIGVAAAGGPVRYVATATVRADDPDHRDRIAAHRARRPQTFSTVETSDLTATLTGRGDGVEGTEPTLIDDLGAWLTARLDAVGWDSNAAADGDFAAATHAFVDAAAAYRGDLVIVSPEVGLSLVPPTASGRIFQDLLGRLNSDLAAVADRVELVVAGRTIALDVTLDTDRTTSAPAAPARAEASAPIPTAPEADPRPAEPLIAAPATTTAPSTTTASGTERADPLAFVAIDPPDRDAGLAARERQQQLTKPAGSLGRVERLAEWIAACQGACPPAQLERPRIVVFAGDHGVATSGVSAYPPEVTAQMVTNFVSGGAAINVLAAQAGATVRIEDIAVAGDTAADVSRHKIRRSSGDISHTDALTDDEAVEAVAAGRAIADQEVDSGADLLIAGDMGIGNTTPAAALIGSIVGVEVVRVVGRGTGIDDATWMRKTAAIRDAMFRARPHTGNPKALLRTVGGADIAAMAGFLAQAAVRRTPVILDGVVVSAAALVAQELAPGASAWWVAGHRSTEPAHEIALARLDLEPIVDLKMRLGEGTGAALALPILRSAVAVLSEMATFDSAGVSRG